MPPFRPRVSIVIPSHDAVEFLEECVASAAAQTFDSLEIIIVDDASSDGSLELAQQLATRHPSRPIRVLSEHARCSAVTRNTGIAAACGDYIVNLDADNMLDPRFVEHCAAALDSQPRAAVAYGTWQVFGERSGTIAPRLWDFSSLLEANYIDANSMFRRSAWQQVGGFSTDLRYEDWDLWVKFGAAGWFGVPVREAVFHYRVRSEGQNVANAPRNSRIRAEFVHRRPHLYTAAKQDWARRVRAEAGEAPALPAYSPPNARAAEPCPPKLVVGFVGEVPGGPAPAPAIAALEADGVPARSLRAVDGASLGMAEELGRQAGADWIIALEPGVVCSSPWPDLDLAEAIAFADSLGFDAMTGEDAEGSDLGPMAWKLAPSRRTVCPVPLLCATPDSVVEARARLLSRCLRDLMVAAAVRGGHGAGAPDPEALGRWVGRTAGLGSPVAADVMQAATLAVEEGASDALLDTGEASVLLAAARLREAELRARNEPQAVDRRPRAVIGERLQAGLDAAATFSLDTRATAIAVHVDELEQHPELGRSYAEGFTAAEDATLVIFDTESDPAALELRLTRMAEGLGLDKPDGPDVLGVSLDPIRADRLPFHLDALLSAAIPSGPLSELPRFGAAQIPALARAIRQSSAAAAT